MSLFIRCLVLLSRSFYILFVEIFTFVVTVFILALSFITFINFLLLKIDTQRSQTKISLAFFLSNLCAMVHINEAIKTIFTSLKIVLFCVFYFYSFFLSKNVLEIKPKY